MIKRAIRLFCFKNEAVISSSLIPNERMRGNWNTIPSSDEVIHICDKNVPISQIFLIPKPSLSFARSSNE